MSIGSTISSLIGWCYFVAWSFSFYPQTILNWKRKRFVANVFFFLNVTSVQGLSIDFLCYNVYGFLCYWIYNMSFFFSHEIQDEYKQRNPESNGSLVRFNDVVFAMHAFLVSSFTLMQTFYYKRDNDQTVSSVAKYFFVVTGIGIIGFLFVISINKAWWIDLLYYLSFIKMAVSLIKYMPQVWINYKRKSTVGWSIHNILLDFTGGVLSISQLFLDASLNGDWSGVSGNPVKFGLGLQSIVFDVVFMMQHYILYRENNDKSDEEETRQLMDEEQE